MSSLANRVALIAVVVLGLAMAGCDVRPGAQAPEGDDTSLTVSADTMAGASEPVEATAEPAADHRQAV